MDIDITKPGLWDAVFRRGVKSCTLAHGLSAEPIAIITKASERFRLRTAIVAVVEFDEGDHCTIIRDRGDDLLDALQQVIETRCPLLDS